MSNSGSQPDKTPASADLSGRSLGSFQLLRRLGRGAMAEVYLAEQSSLSRRVALKILKPELAEDQVYLRRFHREAQAAASLVHANIVQIHEVGQIDHFHYIAQEYVEGQNLREWISRQGPPDLPHALSIMRQAAAALAKAAEHGIVHRDIKPENIMLTRGGEVKVADFGLARFSREGDAVDLTQVGMTLGTPLYMSPEQVEGKPLDPRSDIYSLGVTCYHMLAGSPPFSGETALGVAVQHLKKQAQPLESLRADLPASLCRIVHKMLSKNPDQRYPSAHELLRELRRVQAEHLGDTWPEDLPGWETVGPELPLQPHAELTQRLDSLLKSAAARPRRGRNALLLGAGVVGVFLLGSGVALLTAREAPLLTPPPLAPLQVEKQETALRQWYFASQVGTEEAWRSVIEYFPKNEYLVPRAKQQLARIYLREERYDQAMAIFQALAALGEGEENDELRAFGLAGQCGVLTLLGRYRESARALEKLWPIRSKLTDLQMQQLVDAAVRRNRSELGLQSGQQWRQWLEEQFRENN